MDAWDCIISDALAYFLIVCDVVLLVYRLKIDDARMLSNTPDSWASRRDMRTSAVTGMSVASALLRVDHRAHIVKLR